MGGGLSLPTHFHSLSSELPETEIEELLASTGFDRHHVHNLYHRFKHLDTQNRGYLTRHDLLSIPEIDNNPIGELLVNGFFVNPTSPEYSHGQHHETANG